MRRLLVTILMLASWQAAAAEWMLLRENDSARYYVHPATTRSAENTVRMWVLFDHKSVKLNRGKPYMSTRAEEEFDCEGKRWRMVFYSLHYENMGNGDAVYASPRPVQWEWEPVRPESTVEAFWKLACGKK